MAEQPMETALQNALWRQFGAGIDMLENALLACPESLWKERLWIVPPQSRFPPQFAEFWYITFHVLIWSDLYLSGVPEEEFAPPEPFIKGEIDSRETLPEQPYTREVLHTYLAFVRQKCHAQFLKLSDEQAYQIIDYHWPAAERASLLELHLYSLRHIQEHVAQLSLFLGQHGIPDEKLRWVGRTKAK